MIIHFSESNTEKSACQTFSVTMQAAGGLWEVGKAWQGGGDQYSMAF